MKKVTKTETTYVCETCGEIFISETLCKHKWEFNLMWFDPSYKLEKYCAICGASKTLKFSTKSMINLFDELKRKKKK